MHACLHTYMHTCVCMHTCIYRMYLCIHASCTCRVKTRNMDRCRDSVLLCLAVHMQRHSNQWTFRSRTRNPKPQLQVMQMVHVWTQVYALNISHWQCREVENPLRMAYDARCIEGKPLVRFRAKGAKETNQMIQSEAVQM